MLAALLLISSRKTCTESTENMAKTIGMAITVLRKTIQTLKEQGLIQIEYRPRKITTAKKRYRFMPSAIRDADMTICQKLALLQLTKWEMRTLTNASPSTPTSASEPLLPPSKTRRTQTHRSIQNARIPTQIQPLQKNPQSMQRNPANQRSRKRNPPYPKPNASADAKK